MKKSVNIFIQYYLFLIILEFIFRIVCIQSISCNILYMFIYLIPITLLLVLINKLLNKFGLIVNRILLVLISLYYCLELIFYRTFKVFFSIKSSGMANNLLSFLSDATRIVISNWYYIIIMFIPCILLFIISKKNIYKKLNIREIALFIILIVNGFNIFHLSIMCNKDMRLLYYKVDNSSLYKEYTGVISTTFLDIKRVIFNFEGEVKSVSLIKDEIKDPVYEKNELSIDFDDLILNENDNTLKNMHIYFKNEEGTSKNKYTGMFKDKNLILFMAESFNSVGVSETLTPTLYKLINSGFVFDNYYSPVIYSTIGGEYQELTGLYPNIGILSKVWRSGKNNYSFGIGNVFKDKGYTTYAYHNNQYNFQNRDKYLISIGLDNYIGCGNGLESKINCKQWPQSDIEMINSTIDDIDINNKFMTYYVTVSGHMAYNWGNAISKKYKEFVKDLNYSEEVKAYLATQIELDKALESLINKLKEKNILDDTVIALVGDHYPYALSLDNINEVSLYERDNTFLINKSNFILWNNKMDTINITKIASQLDVIPTLYNLFGIDYDSRLIMGKDILSTSEGLAIFNNQSWISDKGMYNASTKKFTSSDGSEINDDYINNINQIVSNRVSMSKLLMENNYYSKVLKKDN